MDSNAFIDTFGTRSDLYVDKIGENAIDYSSFTDEKKIDIDTFMYREDGKELYGKFLKTVEDKLKEEGMPAHTFTECIYQYKIIYNGDSYNYRMQQTVGNADEKMKTLEGEVPTNKNEIAVGKAMADNLGIKIGDTLEIDFGSCKEKCTVTGIVQSMNNMGDIVFLHKDAPTSFEYCQGCMSTVQVTFTDDPTKEEVQNRKEKLKDILKTDEIKDQREFCVDTMNALDTFKSVEMLLMAITIVVIILVTIMMERSFIADEKKQIAILKAVGFRDSDVIRWQVIRFGILAIISVVIAMALSIPATNLAISPIFGMMGAKKVDFVYSFISLIQYPLVIVAVTVAIAWITALYSKTVEARDTASIE
jgi:putative ABC transport system permease protein